MHPHSATSKLTRGLACPCVRQGYIKGDHVVATVHGGGITIGGRRSAADFLIKMISRTHEIKKQVIGEDADLEKSGRILNRVVEWGRDGITIEADQRHAREILKNLGSEQARHAATPCNVDRKNVNSAAGREGRKGENRCEQGTDQTRSGRCE